MIVRCIFFIWLSSILLSFGGCQQAPNTANVPESAFWEQQGLEVLDRWDKEARDTAYGGFHSFLDRQWKNYNGSDKYPGMISRHLFSYSVGYMLTGEKHYLHRASQTADYLIRHGWDRQYGGWYNALSRRGAVRDSSKDGFFQPYAITGLTMYYFITHDPQILDYIERSHQIMQEHAWDSLYGGYYRSLNRDLAVQNTDKDFSPQLAPVSGYLIYLYLATRDQAYLDKMERILEVVTRKMRFKDEPWILERFDRKWNYTYSIREDSTEVNTGHHAEVVWMLLRLHRLTGKDAYLKKAMKLQEPLYQHGLEERSGAWYHRIGRRNPSYHSTSVPWWIQAYGNMLSLYLYDQTGQDRFLKAFRRGAEFWNNHLIDDQYCGAYLSVGLDGSIQKGSKAMRSKTSYHTLEHALLNTLYTGLWVHHQPVTLHFHITRAQKGERLYPLPVEGPDAVLQEVKINGSSWNDFKPREGYIVLPAGEDLDMEVTVTGEK